MLNDGAAWIAGMRRGDDETAWAISDRVLARRNPTSRDDPTLPYHQRWVWDGSALAGRTVLVRCYHGLGDTLQFARFLPALSAKAESVTVEAPPALCTLLAQIPGLHRLIPFRPASPTPRPDTDVEIMELHHALRIPVATVSPAYLHVTPAPAPPTAIGVCTQAGGWDDARSLPSVARGALLQTIRASGTAVFTLQPGADPGFVNAEGAPSAIEATAALMAGLARIMTVDTMVAHLAGALGLPAWLLLKQDADWRWGEGEAGSPWYPGMRIFRQSGQGDWTHVIDRIANALSADSPAEPAHRRPIG